MKIDIELTDEQKKKADELSIKIIDAIKENIDLEDKINQALVVYTLWMLLETLQEGANVRLSEVKMVDDKG